MRLVLFVLLMLSGCAAIQRMEARNAACLQYCQDRYGFSVLAMTSELNVCRCVDAPLPGEKP